MTVQSSEDGFAGGAASVVAAGAALGARTRLGMGMLCLAVAMSGFVWLAAGESQRQWGGAAHQQVALGSEYYRVSPLQLGWLQDFSELHFHGGEQEARALVADELNVRLDHAFAGVSARIPEFADWYYSLGGEYSRMSMAALSWVSLADGDFVANRVAATLFPEDSWDRALAEMEGQLAEQLLVHQTTVREGWLAELSDRLSAHRVPAPVAGAGEPDDERRGVRLDLLVSELAQREQAALHTRMSISSAAAGGVAAGPALWRAAHARRAATGSRAVAARGAARGTARAGSAAAGGAVACSPGGPVALGCALVAGAATWIAADWALLRIDEAMNRGELMSTLDAGLAELRTDMEREMLQIYDAMIAAHYASIQEDIRSGFVPAHAGGH